MAVSVRMEPVLEQQLEAAAKRQGVTKSQFIIEAVERALGQKDAYRVLLDVQQQYGLAGPATNGLAVNDGRREGAALGGDAWRADLRARHDAAMADWLAYQAAKQAGEEWPPAVKTAAKTSAKTAAKPRAKR